METALLKEYGIFALIAVIAVKMLIDIFRDKSAKQAKALEDNTEAVKDLTASMKEIKEQVAEIPKMKTDIKRNFAASKIIAGDQWPHIRKEITEEF